MAQNGPTFLRPKVNDGRFCSSLALTIQFWGFMCHGQNLGKLIRPIFIPLLWSPSDLSSSPKPWFLGVWYEPRDYPYWGTVLKHPLSYGWPCSTILWACTYEWKNPHHQWKFTHFKCFWKGIYIVGYGCFGYIFCSHLIILVEQYCNWTKYGFSQENSRLGGQSPSPDWGSCLISCIWQPSINSL